MEQPSCFETTINVVGRAFLVRKWDAWIEEKAATVLMAWMKDNSHISRKLIPLLLLPSCLRY
jgi:hypothetical protein